MGTTIPSYVNSFHLMKTKKNILDILQRFQVNWFDLYSPVDLISLRMDVDSGFRNIGLKSQNAQFYKMYSDIKYSEVKKDLFSLHFHYIICGDKPINILNFYYLLTHNKPIDGYERYNEKN